MYRLGGSNQTNADPYELESHWEQRHLGQEHADADNKGETRQVRGAYECVEGVVG